MLINTSMRNNFSHWNVKIGSHKPLGFLGNQQINWIWIYLFVYFLEISYLSASKIVEVKLLLFKGVIWDKSLLSINISHKGLWQEYNLFCGSASKEHGSVGRIHRQKLGLRKGNIFYVAILKGKEFFSERVSSQEWNFLGCIP